MMRRTRPAPELLCTVCGTRIPRGVFGRECKTCDKITHEECWEKHKKDDHEGRASSIKVKS